MLDWIIPTFLVIFALLVLAEVLARWFSWRRRESRIYTRLAKTVNRLGEDVQKDKEVLTIANHAKELEKASMDK